MVLCPSKVSECCGSRSALQSLCDHNWSRPVWGTRFSSTGSPVLKICKALGSSSSSVPTHTSCIHYVGCLLRRLSISRLNMTPTRGGASLLLGVSLTHDSWEKSSLPMSMGGCGLRSASRTSSSAYWASFVDSLRMIHQRHPAVADQMVRSLTQVSIHRHFVAAAACHDQLIACGFSPPTWAEAALARPRAVLEALHMDGPCQGWQHVASACVEDHFFQSVVLPRCLPPERALLRSQGGPLSGLPFVACPSSPHQRFASHFFRVLLLRCLHLPASSLVPLLSVWPSSRRPWPSPHKLPDFRGLGTSWIRPGVRCRPCLSRSGARVRTNVFVRGSSSSGSSRPTTPRSGC